MILFVLAACTGAHSDQGNTLVPGPAPSETGTPPTSVVPTGDTGATTEGKPVVASCALDPDHPLRVLCEATLHAAGSATLELSAADAGTRTFVSEELLVDHEILGWGLQADTTYDWAIDDAFGTVTTGPIPQLLADADITVTGTPNGFDAALTVLTCNGQRFFTMIEGDGDIVWFHRDDVWGSNWQGYDWSQADRSLLTQSSSTLVETGVGGAELLRITGTSFSGSLHHDVARWNQYTYSIFSRSTNVNVDGIFVFEGTKLLGEFFLGDHYDTTGGFGDWSHANGLNATEDGQLIFSLLNFDAVLSIDGDPASPKFLQINWLAAGNPPSDLPNPDYVAVAGPLEGFSGQHNPHVVGDKLWVFDNAGVGGGSRALRTTLDAKAGTITHDASWNLGVTCPIQSGAVPLEGGGVLASCQSNGRAAAFEEGNPSAVWSLDADCGGPGFGVRPNRVIPILIE